MNKDPYNSNDSFLISDVEKKQLKQRIFGSISSIKRRKRMKYTYSIAATIILLVGFAYYENLSNNTGITDFVNTSDINVDNNLSKVTIILDDQDGINLEGDNTSISYSKNGEYIDLGNSKTLKQKSHSKKEVKYNTLIVPYGKRSMIKLSDGTTAWLNAGSKLIYPAIFNSEKREVYLIGEASFDVAHDAEHPFMVLTENQDIEVLGTVFNVSSYPDDTSNFVVLKSGSVKLTHKLKGKTGLFKNNKKESIMTPGTMANINLVTNKVTAKQVNVDHYFAWMEGVLIVRNNDLSHIIKRLSRFYNVQITIENKKLASETFSGYLDLKENIEHVLEILKESTSLQFERTQTNGIIIN